MPETQSMALGAPSTKVTPTYYADIFLCT